MKVLVESKKSSLLEKQHQGSQNNENRDPDGRRASAERDKRMENVDGVVSSSLALVVRRRRVRSATVDHPFSL